MVRAGRLALPITRSQAEYVAATLHTGHPRPSCSANQAVPFEAPAIGASGKKRRDKDGRGVDCGTPNPGNGSAVRCIKIRSANNEIRKKCEIRNLKNAHWSKGSGFGLRIFLRH